MPIENNDKQTEWLGNVIETLTKINEQAKEKTTRFDQCEYTVINSMPNYRGETEHRVDLTLLFTDKSKPPSLEK